MNELKNYTSGTEQAYLTGKHFLKQKEWDLAVKYFQIAANKGCAKSMNNLGFIYQMVYGKLDKAKELYKRAVRYGDNVAFNNLGLMYGPRMRNNFIIIDGQVIQLNTKHDYTFEENCAKAQKYFLKNLNSDSDHTSANHNLNSLKQYTDTILCNFG